MKFKNFYLPALISACMLTSCVDDKYDLSDIDTTVRVEVNDLTIPLNLDEILLSNIIEESDQLKVVDGQYVITESGDFTSSSVEIDKFTLKSQKLDPQHKRLEFNTFAAGLMPEDAGCFEIDPTPKQFDFKSNAIPAEITYIKNVTGNLTFNFEFVLNGISQVTKKVELTNISIQLPKGLNVTDADGGNYDSTSGILTMPSKIIETKTSQDETYSFSIEVDMLNFEELNATLNEHHDLEVNGDFYVLSGKLIIKKADLIISTEPSILDLTINYKISDFELKTLSGKIDYTITGVNISDVSLNNLPDVLSQKGTNIMLANPQIYLKVNNTTDKSAEKPNPLEQYKLFAQTSLTITSVFGPNDEKANTANTFQIGYPVKNEPGVFSFCLSPSNPANKPSEYANAEWVEFKGLSDVVSNGGNSDNGMPKTLKINLVDPKLPNQEVTDFKLGEKLGDISGSYKFLAPVALKEDATIIYSDKMDGWDSEDLEDLTITDLHIAATITSSIPLSLDFQAYPVDKNGNRINNVEIEGAEIIASSDPQPVDIHIKGTIKDLAGIEFTATAIVPPGYGDKVLRPDMTIKVSKLRPRVSGYYEKEL